jgi:hypothetical protein
MRRCAGRGTCHLSFLGMLPTSQLFEVDVDGLVPPRQVSKLSRRNIRRSTIPPKVAARWRGKGSSVTVGSTHPANVAAAKKQADVASRVVAAPTRESPKRGANRRE